MKPERIWGTMHPFFEEGAVFGRKMANAGFLTALLQADPFDAYHFFLKKQRDKAHLERIFQELFPGISERKGFMFSPVRGIPEALQRHRYACFHFSDWVNDFVDLSIYRNAYSKELFPITAPVHTLSYTRYGAGFLKHLWGGVTRRDHIVATSTATQEVVAEYFAQLRQGYGLAEKDFPAPGITRIPLGVDPSLFAGPEEKQALGTSVRAELGLGDKVVFLSFSRVSYLSKMDFLPILDAFRRAQGLGLAADRCHFILAGRMDKDDSFAAAITQLAGDAGIGFSLLPFPDAPDNERRKALFAAADVFLSPVDNIQETFGLTILEAFAASLPVIASGIDGYKDLVRHGENGFLVPTLGPTSATGTGLSAVMESTDIYHLYFAQQCVVEIPPFADHLVALGTNPELRARMGRKGREGVLAEYTWAAVVQRYIQLWSELAAAPLSAEEEAAARQAPHPVIPDFTRIFSGYFGAVAGDADVRNRLVRTSAHGAKLGKENPMVVYALVRHRVDKERLDDMLRRAATPITFGELADRFALRAKTDDRDFLLLWALKHDLLEFC